MASRVGSALSKLPAVTVGPVETNIVMLNLDQPVGQDVAHAAAARGVLLHAMDPKTLRVVTHRDVDGDDIGLAIEVLSDGLRTALEASGAGGGAP